ncbi:MAG: type II toxin-antitoxin system PemK/MazF family toxin [Rhodobacteraceae bacterium]|nr:type II toxin-antitoxin system PemK/MazF family toxin [Paracoccaceae bacterium]
MALRYHPKQGSIVRVSFDDAFRAPEMVKPRLCVIVSKPIQARPNLCTVVPLSTTAPTVVMPYHCKLDIPFDIPMPWGNLTRWVKGDMVYAAGFHRVDLLRLGKDGKGQRIYQISTLPEDTLAQIQKCVLHGLGLSGLTKHL